MLEEPLELLHRPVGRGQEGSRVVRTRLDLLYVVELCDQIAAEALDSAADLNGVS